MSDIPENLVLIHTFPPHHLDGCVALISVAVASFNLTLRCCHVTGQVIRQAEMHPAVLTHDLIWLVVSLTLGQN